MKKLYTLDHQLFSLLPQMIQAKYHTTLNQLGLEEDGDTGDTSDSYIRKAPGVAKIKKEEIVIE